MAFADGVAGPEEREELLAVFEEEDRLMDIDLDDLFDACDDYAQRSAEDRKLAESEAVATAIGAEKTAIRVSPGHMFNDLVDANPLETHRALLDALPTADMAYVHVMLPDAFSPTQAMAIGTAGYTASLCVEALLSHGVKPEQGEILVTGATGGVGSVAVALLARAGFTVAAAIGKTSEGDYLKTLGASVIIDRAELSAAGKPMQKERWAGVVDSVGSHTLANACAQTRYGGVIAACGLAQGMDFPASVAPFILRGVSLLGIDSVMAPRPPRLAAWARLARDLDGKALDMIATEIGLAGVVSAAADLMQGKVRGRIVVDVNK